LTQQPFAHQTFAIIMPAFLGLFDSESWLSTDSTLLCYQSPSVVFTDPYSAFVALLLGLVMLFQFAWSHADFSMPIRLLNCSFCLLSASAFLMHFKHFQIASACFRFDLFDYSTFQSLTWSLTDIM
jgi:hypothetical protein